MKYMKIVATIILTLVYPLMLWSQPSPSTPYDHVPEWSKEAIWYQIYPDIFRNGDTSNDPRPEDIAGSYPGHIPSGWEVANWGMDFYSLEDWNMEIKGKIDNDGPSNHNFDARNWRHIDINFGPDPDGDKAIMDAEIPARSATWTAVSFRLFLASLMFSPNCSRIF